ncbi:MAG: D-tyrosyl-tRNA(Tyr) deacylase [Planctomycetales bacterium]|nr:D-tyrosyl-tRNA(Tyr) deacylase [Planctomycetales bacterium]
MRAVVQRVSHAAVSVGDDCVGHIDVGLAVLLGVEQGDDLQDVEYLVAKTIGLRIFEDGNGKMNLSVCEVGGSVLAISQFTLFGDVRRGKRPSFTQAAPPEIANRLYEQYCLDVRSHGITVATGRFQADMQVSLTNDGPVTILLDSRRLF